MRQRLFSVIMRLPGSTVQAMYCLSINQEAAKLQTGYKLETQGKRFPISGQEMSDWFTEFVKTKQRAECFDDSPDMQVWYEKMLLYLMGNGGQFEQRCKHDMVIVPSTNCTWSVICTALCLFLCKS